MRSDIKFHLITGWAPCIHLCFIYDLDLWLQESFPSSTFGQFNDINEDDLEEEMEMVPLHEMWQGRM
ncbi:hypothetical protein U1Q18_011659 [Sarracenia purpurea var. burkii]